MIVPGIPFVQGRNAYTDQDGRHYGIAIHNTSNTASAKAEARYAQVRTDGVSCHFFVDGIEVIQSLDTRAKAGHAGSTQGNENSIAIEIVGQNGNPRDWWLANVRWDLLGAVLAQVIRAELPGFQVRRASVAEMQADPKVPAFYAHDDMRQAWGHTDHDDPGPNFPWDALFSAVNAALGQQEDDMTPDQANSLTATDARVREALLFGHKFMDDVPGAGKHQPVYLPTKLEEIEAKVDALAAKIDAIATGGVDYAALAKAVNDDAAARLAE